MVTAAEDHVVELVVGVDALLELVFVVEVFVWVGVWVQVWLFVGLIVVEFSMPAPTRPRPVSGI